MKQLVAALAIILAIAFTAPAFVAHEADAATKKSNKQKKSGKKSGKKTGTVNCSKAKNASKTACTGGGTPVDCTNPANAANAQCSGSTKSSGGITDKGIVLTDPNGQVFTWTPPAGSGDCSTTPPAATCQLFTSANAGANKRISVTDCSKNTPGTNPPVAGTPLNYWIGTDASGNKTITYKSLSDPFDPTKTTLKTVPLTLSQHQTNTDPRAPTYSDWAFSIVDCPPSPPNNQTVGNCSSYSLDPTHTFWVLNTSSDPQCAAAAALAKEQADWAKMSPADQKADWQLMTPDEQTSTWQWLSQDQREAAWDWLSSSQQQTYWNAMTPAQQSSAFERMTPAQQTAWIQGQTTQITNLQTQLATDQTAATTACGNIPAAQGNVGACANLQQCQNLGQYSYQQQQQMYSFCTSQQAQCNASNYTAIQAAQQACSNAQATVANDQHSIAPMQSLLAKEQTLQTVSSVLGVLGNVTAIDANNADPSASHLSGMQLEQAYVGLSPTQQTAFANQLANLTPDQTYALWSSLTPDQQKGLVALMPGTDQGMFYLNLTSNTGANYQAAYQQAQTFAQDITQLGQQLKLNPGSVLAGTGGAAEASWLSTSPSGQLSDLQILWNTLQTSKAPTDLADLYILEMLNGSSLGAPSGTTGSVPAGIYTPGKQIQNLQTQLTQMQQQSPALEQQNTQNAQNQLAMYDVQTQIDKLQLLQLQGTPLTTVQQAQLTQLQSNLSQINTLANDASNRASQDSTLQNTYTTAGMAQLNTNQIQEQIDNLKIAQLQGALTSSQQAQLSQLQTQVTQPIQLTAAQQAAIAAQTTLTQAQANQQTATQTVNADSAALNNLQGQIAIQQQALGGAQELELAAVLLSSPYQNVQTLLSTYPDIAPQLQAAIPSGCTTTSPTCKLNKGYLEQIMQGSIGNYPDLAPQLNAVANQITTLSSCGLSEYEAQCPGASASLLTQIQSARAAPAAQLQTLSTQLTAAQTKYNTDSAAAAQTQTSVSTAQSALSTAVQALGTSSASPIVCSAGVMMNPDGSTTRSVPSADGKSCAYVTTAAVSCGANQHVNSDGTQCVTNAPTCSAGKQLNSDGSMCIYICLPGATRSYQNKVECDCPSGQSTSFVAGQGETCVQGQNDNDSTSWLLLELGQSFI